ncbi:MAG: methylated-DNA--[protein]-cysteine S-methyltransferase [Tissierellia bacterium]|nr:methylated-DNA--[protein]-cysteine S-methyltransferase [Tissierellia bacterium]MDD4725519.1 methylated-DNA--[protein]-cysteine S-methyltransferase [Tissierellia bacterium]
MLIIDKNFAVYETPFGYMRMTYEGDKIIDLEIIKDVDDRGVSTQITDMTYNEIIEYFEGKRKEFDFPYELRGTEFQNKVWKALCDIPYGETKTYKDIAIAVGNTKASRAVGMACNRNPIMIAVPCHRVIGSNKKLVGYAGGIDMKRRLIDMENENK